MCVGKVCVTVYPLCVGKGEVDCSRRVCEVKVCGVGYMPETVPGSQDTCCPIQVFF